MIIVDTREFVTVIVEIRLNQKLERDIKGNVEHFQRKRVLVISWDLIENLLLSLFLYVFECLVRLHPFDIVFPRLPDVLWTFTFDAG